jgi:hypothetical protein
MRRTPLLLLLALVGCRSREMVQLKYELVGIDPAQVVRIETVVGIDPQDGRGFFADQPYRAVGTGVGYEVTDLDGDGKREFLITQDTTLGFKLAPRFEFTLLPPAEEAAPSLIATARAVGDSRNTLGETMSIKASFGAGATVDIRIADQRCGGAVCAPDERCCDGACRRVNDDAAHCGGCGGACNGGETCVGAVCRCGTGSNCEAGRTCCGDSGCFDLMNDAFHCGSCDKKCSPGEACVAGACRCAWPPPAPPARCVAAADAPRSAALAARARAG